MPILIITLPASHFLCTPSHEHSERHVDNPIVPCRHPRHKRIRIPWERNQSPVSRKSPHYDLHRIFDMNPSRTLFIEVLGHPRMNHSRTYHREPYSGINVSRPEPPSKRLHCRLARRIRRRIRESHVSCKRAYDRNLSLSAFQH